MDSIPVISAPMDFVVISVTSQNLGKFRTLYSQVLRVLYDKYTVCIFDKLTDTSK
jgi:hypothetical protein